MVIRAYWGSSPLKFEYHKNSQHTALNTKDTLTNITIEEDIISFDSFLLQYRSNLLRVLQEVESYMRNIVREATRNQWWTPTQAVDRAPALRALGEHF